MLCDVLVYDVFSSFYYNYFGPCSCSFFLHSFFQRQAGCFTRAYRAFLLQVLASLYDSCTYVKYIIIATTNCAARYLVSASLTSGLIQLNNLKLDRSNYYRIFLKITDSKLQNNNNSMIPEIYQPRHVQYYDDGWSPSSPF